MEKVCPRSEHYLNPSEQQAKPGSKVSGGFSYVLLPLYSLLDLL